jgi:hypothetical protein
MFSVRAMAWETLLALAMHLIPTFVLIAVLVVAWRWRIGAVTPLPGCCTSSRYYRVPFRWQRNSLGLYDSSAAFVIAALFLAN